MLNLDTVLSQLQASKTKKTPDEAELRRLPDKRALIYARLSDPKQVRESKESIREFAQLVGLANCDGYTTQLPYEEIERRFSAIQEKKLDAIYYWTDGQIECECRDLGISGQLGVEKRPGLAKLMNGCRANIYGVIYTSEVSRLSRDINRVLSYQILKTLKDHNVKIRTPEGILSPQVERDWEAIKDEFEEAANELKTLNRRLARKRKNKAMRSEWVGQPIPAGFILEVIGRDRDGKPIFGKLTPYRPHMDAVVECLKALVSYRSGLRAAQILKERLAFQLFPSELSYMETRTCLRACRKTAAGYEITPDVIIGIATKPIYVGIYSYGDFIDPSYNAPYVDANLWLEAHAIASNKKKSKGKTIYYSPLAFAGLLFAEDGHSISAHSAERRYVDDQDYQRGRGSIALDIDHRFLDDPLVDTILFQCHFGEYASAVLERLQQHTAQIGCEEKQQELELSNLNRRVENLKNALAEADTTGQRKLILEQIEAHQEKLGELKTRPKKLQPSLPIDVSEIKRLLENFEQTWPKLKPEIQNHFLRTILERVILKYDEGELIYATIHWCTGYQQALVIKRPIAKTRKQNRWTSEEDRLLKIFWPSAPEETLLKYLYPRSREAIASRAFRLNFIRRSDNRHYPTSWRRWTSEGDKLLEELYESGTPIENIMAMLDRSKESIEQRAAFKKLKRPREVKWKTGRPTWQLLSQNFVLSEPATWGR